MIDNPVDILLSGIRSCWRFRWIGLATAWVVALLGCVLIVYLPDRYEARAQFYVDNSSRLKDIVTRLGMEPKTDSRLFLVRQAMLGTPQLAKVARATDLYLRATDEAEFLELTEKLGTEISITTGRGGDAKNLYAISYQDEEREMALKVVNALLNTFIRDVIDAKSSETDKAAGFLKGQLEYYRKLLAETEKKIEIFKRENPAYSRIDGAGFFENLQARNDQLIELDQLFAIQIRRQQALRRQLRDAEPFVPTGSTSTIAMTPVQVVLQRIVNMRVARTELLLRFTEAHPDVRALSEQINSLEEQRAEQLLRRSETTGVDEVGAANNPVYIQIQLALSEANVRLEELSSQITNKEADIDRLSKLMDTAPRLEREFIELKRDYGKYQSLYDEVLLQTERERIGRVGDESDVVSFNIVQPPIANLEPVSPQRVLLAAVALALSIGMGGSIAYLLAALRPVFSSARGLFNNFDLPILGSISMTLRINSGRQILVFSIGVILLPLLFGSALFLRDNILQFL